MAEKNTHSILETIKKKLNKFDSKTEKTSKISDVASEFEYITTAPKAEVPNEVMGDFLNEKPLNNKSVLQAGDELNLDDFNEKIPEIKKEEIAPIEQPATLDLDAEISSFQNEESQQEAQNISVEAEAEMNEDDIEDYEDEVDFAEEEEVEETEEEEEEVYEEDENEKDELSFEDDEESPKLESEDSHELDLEEEQEVDADPLNLEEDSAPLNLEEKPQEDANPLKLEEEPEEDSAPLNMEEPEEDSDPLNLEEKPEIIQPDSPAVLENESEEKLVAPQDIKEPKENDELDFSDMLDLEEDKVEVASPLENKPLEAAKEEAEEKDPFEMELEELDKELARKEISQQQDQQPETQQPQKPKPVVEDSKHDEIDLEFEQEMAAINPEISEKIAEVSAAPKEEADDEFTFAKEPEAQNNFVKNSAGFMSAPNQQNQIFPLAMDKNNKAESRILNDTTIMQTSESIRKLVDAKNVVAGISNFSQSPALAELATQLMEPKLEKWLNENLGSLVEKIVREEIKKIIPKE